MKISRAGDNLGLVVLDAFDCVRPFACCLYGRFDGLCSGVHRQGHILARQLARSFKEHAEFVRIKCSRDDIEAPNLVFDEIDEALVTMAVTHGRVRAHHVEVFLAGIIPDKDAVAAGQNNRQRMIILRTITCFKFDVLIHGEILQQ